MEPALTVITPYRDGPLVVRGPVRLVDQDGQVIDVDRRTIALCRCGRSRLRPFCDGTHKLVLFSARAPQRIWPVSAGSWRARPPARSTAAMFSWTASASTCSSKKSVAAGSE